MFNSGLTFNLIKVDSNLQGYFISVLTGSYVNTYTYVCLSPKNAHTKSWLGFLQNHKGCFRVVWFKTWILNHTGNIRLRAPRSHRDRMAETKARWGWRGSDPWRGHTSHRKTPQRRHTGLSNASLEPSVTEQTLWITRSGWLSRRFLDEQLWAACSRVNSSKDLFYLMMVNNYHKRSQLGLHIFMSVFLNVCIYM